MGFSTIDYLVLVAYLAGITAFGVMFRKSQRTVKDYFLGDKNTSWIVISLSIVATETSTLTLIGVPALAYANYARPEQGGNFTYLQVVLGYIVARIIISFLFIPAYFRGNLLTAYELLKNRFGVKTKNFAASLFLIMRALAEGVRVFATSLVLSAVLATSLPSMPNLWLWSIIIVGVLTLVYTFEGGIAAVIWTDLVQLVIYIGGSLLAAYELMHLVPGGWPAIAAQASAANKFQLFSFKWDLSVPFTFWAGLLGGTFLTMASHGTDQLLVQRLLTCKSKRESNDQIFPLFIVHKLPHGVAGLVIAAIFAAAMSNLSGSLNSLASSTVLDFYKPLLGRDKTDESLLKLSRWLTAVWGIVLIGIAVLASRWGSVFTTGLTIASLVYGPMLGAFLLGVLTKRANQGGVMVGMAVTLAVMIFIKFNGPVLQWVSTKLHSQPTAWMDWIAVHTNIAWTWYVLIGTIICCVVGLGTSILTGTPDPDSISKLAPAEIN